MVRHGLAALLGAVNGLLIGVMLLAAGNLIAAEGDASHGVILQYHHVSDKTPASTSVTPDEFRRQMEILQEDGFTVMPLSRLVNTLQQEKPIPDKSVVITIDDAFVDVYQNAAPILKEFNYPFTLFVSTGPVNRSQKGYLTWDQIRELKQQGAELANHTVSHLHMLRRLEGENRETWLQRLKAELDAAEQRIAKETGQNWKYLAYPYGETDEKLIEQVQQWGYLGFGQQSGAVNKGLLESGLAPRFPFNESYVDEKTFRLKASSVPLPITEEITDDIVWNKAGRPMITVTLSEVNGALNCFASGQGAIPVIKESSNRFRIQAPESIPVGRSRYNCTMAVKGQPGRFHWYSKTWIRKKDDGSWYRE